MSGHVAQEELTLSELTSSEFLNCPYCKKTFTAPVLLPCLHIVCLECAVQLAKERTIHKGEGVHSPPDRTRQNSKVVHHPKKERNQQKNENVTTSSKTIPVEVQCSNGSTQDRKAVRFADKSTLQQNGVVRSISKVKAPTVKNNDEKSDAVDQSKPIALKQESEENESEKEAALTENETPRSLEVSPSTNGSVGTVALTCPVCHSIVTLAHQENTQTTTERTLHPIAAHPKPGGNSYSKQVPNNIDKCDANDTNTEGRSTDRTKELNERVEKVVHSSLCVDRFLSSLCTLRRYKSETDRECQYCKDEGSKVDATSLCLECADDLCDACAAAHRKTRLTRDHKVATYSSIRQGLFDHDIRSSASDDTCDIHPGTNVTQYCLTCYLPICKTCRNKMHSSHHALPLQEAFNKLRPEIRQIQEGLARRVPTLEKYRDFLANHRAQLDAAKVKAAAQIEAHVEELLQKIQAYRAELCSRLEGAYTKEVRALDVMEECNIKAERGMSTASQFLGHLHNVALPVELLQVYGPVLRRHQQLVTSQPNALTSRLTSQFQSGPATDQNIEILVGTLAIAHRPLAQKDSPQIRLSVSSLMPAVLPSPVLVRTVHTRTDHDQKDPYPTGLAISQSLMAVVDRENGSVKLYDPQGKYVKQFQGSGSNKLVKPFAATFLDNGALAVSDTEAGKVKVFDWMGNFIRDFQGEAIRHPRGITTNAKGEVVVLDGHLRQLIVLDPNSGDVVKVVRPMTEEDNLPLDDLGYHELLIDPYYVALTHEERMVITDLASPNLKIVDSSGHILVTTLDYGTGQDEALHPSGVCTDKYGQIFLVDTLNSRLHLGLPDGRMSRVLIKEGITNPLSVTIDPTTGHLVIAQAGGKVSVYQYV